MKYCLKWNNLCINLSKADEISIKYIEDKGLVKFLEKYKDKRIILKIETEKFVESEILKLAAIRKQYPDYQFTMALDKIHLPTIEILQKKEIPFYIAQPCKDWETFNYLTKELKVSDIDISGPLGFELFKVQRSLEKLGYKVIVRATPNNACGQTEYAHPLHRFFIRPDDIDLYENFIDVIEFDGLEHQDTFFNIYKKEKMFVGSLSQMIYNLPLTIDNLGLVSAFTERRVECGRECLKGGRCRRCFTMLNISEKMGPYTREEIQKKLKENNNATN